MMMIAGDGVCETIHVPKEPQVTCLATSPRLLLMQPGILGPLDAFVAQHRGCGVITGDATPPDADTYHLTLACSCGAIFDRLVSPSDVEVDLFPKN